MSLTRGGRPTTSVVHPKTPYFCDNSYPTNLLALSLQLWPSGNYAIPWQNGRAYGGQVNVTSYDLFSYGPDKLTYVAEIGVAKVNPEGALVVGLFARD